MAAPKKQSETVSGYFRKIFGENPQWLESTSNAVVIERYNKDHAEPADDRVKANMANVKSNMRKTLRGEGGANGKGTGKKRGRKPKAAAATVVTIKVAPTRASGKSLESLELAIDQCLTTARGMAGLGNEGLEKVIQHLRAARNQVVWQGGE